MWILRFLFFILILFLIYRIIKFILNPKRKLELAHEQKRYYYLDDPNDARKNFLLTYKGVLFEGEKYLGTTDETFDVISIFIWPHSAASLKGLVREDFQFIEQKVREKYPHAALDWKSPVKEFMQQNKNPQAPY
jgi:transposase InsO family protein